MKFLDARYPETFAYKEIIERFAGVLAKYVVPYAVNISGLAVDNDTSEVSTLQFLKTGTENETYCTTNAIDKVSSSSASDTGTVQIIGHTVSGGNFTRVVQTATLNGTTPVTLTTPLARVEKTINTSAADLVGTVYVFEDSADTAGVPDTGAKVHDAINITYNFNRSRKGAFTVPNNQYLCITDFCGYIHRETAAYANVFLEVREKGKIFQQVLSKGLASVGASSFKENYSRPLIVPANADLRIRSTTSADNSVIGADIQGFLLSTVAV